MAHHYSGPDFSFPHGDPRVDLCDLFAFPVPGDSQRSILAMDVHPSFGFEPEGPTTGEPFAPEAIYELKIDTNGDLVADVAFRVRFSGGNGGQSATVRRIEGADAAGTGEGGEIVVQDAPVSMASDAQVTEYGDYRFFAGWRSDPFFFDAEGVLNDFQFTGRDFFADKDVCSMVFEVPNEALGAGGGPRLWHRTLVPGDEKAAYLGGEPANDSRFVDSFAHVLEHAGGYSPEEAKRAAGTLLPDVLPYNPGQPAAYPTNGRKPTDDVADYFLAVFTNRRVPDDGIGPHSDLLSEFPYLGPPHGSYSA